MMMMGGGGDQEDVDLLKGWKDSRLLTEPLTKTPAEGLRCWRINVARIRTEITEARLTDKRHKHTNLTVQKSESQGGGIIAFLMEERFCVGL